MMTFLIGKDLWEIVETGYAEPKDWTTLNANDRVAKKESRRKNAQALFHIQIALDKSLFPRIASAKTTVDAWKTLQEAYQGSDQVKVVKLQTLKREFENLKMQEAENVSDYCVRVKDVVNKMATLGEIVDKEVLIKKVLRSLTPRWNHVAIIIEESKDLSTLQFDHLVGSLMSHEERLIGSFGESGKKVFSSKLQITKNEDANTRSKRNQSQGRGQNQNYPRGRGASRGRGRGRFDKRNIQCYYCKRYGHFERDCRLKEGNNNKGVNYAQEGDEASSNNLFLSYDKAENGTKDIWYLDSGCSNHMSGNKKLFSTMDGSFKSKIKLGDDKALEVVAKGAMEVHTKEGMKSVKDIYYTPQLKHNLLSVGQLCEKNYKVVLENQQCTIYDKNRGNRVVTVVPMSKNRMFPLMFGEHNNHLANMAYEEKSWLWHLRYGHLNFHSLKLQ
jgi:hypothetical protein